MQNESPFHPLKATLLIARGHGKNMIKQIFVRAQYFYDYAIHLPTSQSESIQF